jgi:superfamily I DNA and/or RNA helicase
MSKNYNPFLAKGNIYVIKNQEGKVEKIIGEEKDRFTLKSLAFLAGATKISPRDIQESIKRIGNLYQSPNDNSNKK